MRSRRQHAGLSIAAVLALAAGIGANIAVFSAVYARCSETFDRIVKALAATPGVELVSTINHLTVGGDLWTFRYGVAGRPEPMPVMNSAPCIAS